MSTVYFNMTLHCHQPVGNFDSVFEEAVDKAYMPFLDVLGAHPGVKANLHLSGPLLEWMLENRPAYLERVRDLIENGKIEMVGGGFYEPIMVMLPERDRLGQLEMCRQFMSRHFGDVSGDFRGYWLTERVWEQGLVKSLADAGIRYTLCDDTHFYFAGLSERDLGGYYFTEDEGRAIAVFPIPETLRYTIPFREPHETIDYLRSFAEGGDSVIVYGDDGEKFGLWPETNAHVYGDMWLDRFFTALEQADDIELVFLSEAFEGTKSKGRIFLPDASYREMTEWALPADAIGDLERLTGELKSRDDWKTVRRFVRGGTWRNFRVKYPEANRLYARMMHLSEQLAEMCEDDRALEGARRDLYRAQCNCAYWHGVFGGLYLPHLRDAVAQSLIDCESKLESIRCATKQWTCVEAKDFNFDGEEELYIANCELSAYIAPARGGALYEFNAKKARYPLLNTLARRYEAYHDKLRDLSTGTHGDSVASIHERLKAKEDNLHTLLVYDGNERTSLIDRFLGPAASPEALRDNAVEDLGYFAFEPYMVENIDASESIIITMQRTGIVKTEETGPQPVNLTKKITLERTRPGMRIEYAFVTPGPERLISRYAQEWNFNLLAGNAPDRFYSVDGEPLGDMSTVLAREAKVFALTDQWRRTRVSLRPDRKVEFWTYPVKTVSQSEGGFEGLYQASCVLATFRLVLEPGKEEKFRIDIEVEVLED
ncbi:MAG: alpha-amylase/4-alpha-glucanotransferase domain-containing protein [Planctomycetota bacterium]|jgi:alpha-amylase